MTAQATLNESAPKSAGDPTLPSVSGYAMIREKGRGPKGVVYKARRVFENDLVAIKLFHRGVCDRAMAARLETGVERTSQLIHAGLIRALGFGTGDGHPFLVLEYASGESLANFLFRRQQFPPAKAVGVILYCARTLKFAAEKGFCHGRLHPGRVILGRNNIRIAGVGMGERPEHAAWSVQYPHIFEPLVYTAPEAQPSKPFPEALASAADVYSLGAMLYHLLICEPPFKGNDEGSLEIERRKVKGSVEWPVGAKRAFPADLPELIDAMLNPNPDKRPTYDALIEKLTAIQAELQKSGAEGWQAVEAAAPVAAPIPAPQSVPGADAAKTVIDTQKLAAASPAKPSSSAALFTAEKKKGDSIRHHPKTVNPHYARRSTFDVIFSTLLFCMTALVFCCAAYVTFQPYLPEKYRILSKLIPPPNSDNGASAQRAAAAGDLAAQAAKSANDTGASKAAVPETINAEDAALANHQLDKIREMMLNGDILPSAPLAKLIRNIANRTGRTSNTGIRALILASEIESKVSPGRVTEPLPVIPVAPVAPPPVAKVEEPVPAKPAPVVPAPIPPATKQPDAPKTVSAVAAAIKRARDFQKYFNYSKAKEEMEQFTAKATDEQKRVMKDYRMLVSYEEGLYERCRSRLLDQIKKDPKHQSILQVFPRMNDPVGDDIIDFDDKGLSILVRGGPNQGVKVTPWDKFPANQVLFLMQKLAVATNLEDQIGLAVFAYNRGLSAESDDFLDKAGKIKDGAGKDIPGAKEKADAIANSFLKITHALDAPE